MKFCKDLIYKLNKTKGHKNILLLVILLLITFSITTFYYLQ